MVFHRQLSAVPAEVLQPYQLILPRLPEIRKISPLDPSIRPKGRGKDPVGWDHLHPNGAPFHHWPQNAHSLCRRQFHRLLYVSQYRLQLTL